MGHHRRHHRLTQILQSHVRISLFGWHCCGKPAASPSSLPVLQQLLQRPFCSFLERQSTVEIVGRFHTRSPLPLPLLCLCLSSSALASASASACLCSPPLPPTYQVGGNHFPFRACRTPEMLHLPRCPTSRGFRIAFWAWNEGVKLMVSSTWHVTMFHPLTVHSRHHQQVH